MVSSDDPTRSGFRARRRRVAPPDADPDRLTADSDQPFGRRAVMRKAAATASLGALLGVAGCSESTAPSAGDEEADSDTAASSDASGGQSGTGDGADSDAVSGSSLPASVGLEPLATGFRAPVTVAFPSAVPGGPEPENTDSTAASSANATQSTAEMSSTNATSSANAASPTAGTAASTTRSATTSADGDRAYIVDQSGVVSVYDSGSLLDRPFLDLSDSVEFGGEKGLLGLALHPEFTENRRLFVRYSAPRREGTPSSYSHTFVLAEFEAAADGRTVRRDSERTLLEIPEPQSNHNAGDIAFGPDGYLYVAVGDGGGGADQGQGHVADWYDAVGGGNGQDVTENLLGSVLRIDVDTTADGRPYGVPEDNPLVGGNGRDEHYAWGFRNPWRMSFDGDDLYVGDVGQSRFEEVDLVEAGGNHGWNVKEATHCFERDDCPDRTPDEVRGGEPLVDPIIEYPHSGGEVNGISVIGGYVYRGSALPGLVGRYVFADLNAGGRLFVATPPDETASSDELWSVQPLDVAGGEGSLGRVLSFGRDAAGELYVLGSGGDGGGVYQIVPDS